MSKLRTQDTHKYFTSDYRIYYDNLLSLEFVRLEFAGLTKLAQNYNQDERYKDSKINITVFNYPNLRKDVAYQILSEQINSLEEGEIKGIILSHNDSDQKSLYHSSPFIIAKINGDSLVVDFEGMLSGYIDFADYIKIIGNYNHLQKDRNSCAIFALTSLKNAFRDAKLMEQISSLKLDEDFNLAYLTNSQDAADIPALSTDKKDKYVKTTFFKPELNMKAFYKGHDLARKLNPNHLELLDEKTRQLVLEIDQIRLQKKQISPSDKASPVTSHPLDVSTKIAVEEVF